MSGFLGGGGVAAGTYELSDADLDAIAALSTTAFGRSLLTQANAAAALSTLGAQAQDADLDAIAALATTAYGRSVLTQANAAAVRSLIDAAQTAHTHLQADVTDLNNGLYLGNGSDGALTFDGTTTIAGLVPAASTYTLTQDLHCTTLTVNSGVTIKAQGYAIYVQGAATVNGTVHANGANGSSNGSQGAALAGRLANSVGGGAGNTGVGSAAGTAGILGGIGGAGGSGSAGAGTGALALNGAMTTAQYAAALKTPGPFAVGQIIASASSLVMRGGGGGSGGTGDNTNKGGGGGSGGGVLVICAKTLTIGASGTVSANGGNGGTPSTGNCGGGGAGGGGWVAIFTRTAVTNSGTLTAAAGTVGSGVGTGSAGAAGAAGTVNQVVMG